MSKKLAPLLMLPILAYADASSINSSVSSLYQGSFQSAVADPITGKSDMKTIDGSNTFNAKVTCGSTYSFLNINYSVSSGDISMTARMDKNGDGTKEYTFSPSTKISGVCQNGIVSCDTGTWNNCKYYKWGYSGSLYLTQVPLKDNLGGCYCTNSSCGNLATTNKRGVLDSIGAGIYSAVSSSGIIISKTEYNSDGSIEYYGQSSSQCGGTSTPSFSPQSGYTIDGVDDAMIAQSADENSAYTALTSSLQNQNISSSTCKIQYQPILNKSEVDANLAGSGVTIWCAPWNKYFCPGIEGMLANSYNEYGSKKVVSMSSCSEGCDFATATFVFSDGTSGTYNYGRASGPTFYKHECPTDYTYIAPKCVKEWPSYGTSDGCANLAADSNCKLKEESYCDLDNANCQKTMQNFTPINNNVGVTSSCTTKQGVTQTDTFCVDGNQMNYVTNTGSIGTLTSSSPVYWNINRTYQCESKSDPDMADMSKRFSTSTKSATFNPSNNSFAYTDTTKNEDGSWTTFNSGGTLQLSDANGYVWCEVKWLDTAQTVFSDGTNKSQTTSGGSTWKYERRTCTNNVCPVDTTKGESVTYQCGQTTGDFAGVAAVFQAVGEAADDMICSMQ